MGGPATKYEVIIYRSNEYRSNEDEEADCRNAQEAVELWLETAKQFGHPLPAPRGRRPIFA